MSTDTAREERVETALATSETLPAMAGPSELSWAIAQMRAGERIFINEALVAAYQAASSPHSIRAIKSDMEPFDA